MRANSVRIRVDGFNQTRLLNELSAGGVEIFDLNKISPSVMNFCVAKKHSDKTFAIFERLCYNYTVEKRTDAKAFFSACLSRIGLIVGVVVFSAALWLGYGLIWHVDVAGNEKVDTLTIERALVEVGVSRGKPRGRIDRDGVRNAVNAIDGVLESSVEISGGTVRVTVVEETDFLPPQKQEFSDVCSDYDATVTRIINSAGTTLVSIGSRVKKGETLIGAYSVDAEGNKTRTEAKGEVYGTVAFAKTETFSLKENVSVRTGKTYKSSRYTLFGLNIKGKEKHGFEKFETETETADVFERLFVPLKLRRTVFYEVTEEERVYDLDERAEYFKTLILDEMIVKAGGAEIASSYTLTRISEDMYRINVYMEAEMLIARSKKGE